MPTIAHALVLAALTDLTGIQRSRLHGEDLLQGDLGMSDPQLDVLAATLGFYDANTGDSQVSACMDRLRKATVQELISMAERG